MPELADHLASFLSKISQMPRIPFVADHLRIPHEDGSTLRGSAVGAEALEEIACTTNPLGIKGIGEADTIGAPPTVINAILDALRPLGVGELQMPATPARVWSALHAAQAGIGE